MAKNPEEPLPNLTELLRRASSGDKSAEDAFYGLVHDDLRRLASRRLRALPSSLQTTELVDQAYIRLVRVDFSKSDRARFFACASKCMRSILVDEARRASALKRPAADPLPLSMDLAGPPGCPSIDVLTLDELLTELAGARPDLARVVELTYYGGLTLRECEEATGTSVRTIERLLRAAVAWLKVRMTRPELA